MVVKVIKHPQSREPSVQWCLWYCINVFVQMVKIYIFYLTNAFSRLIPLTFLYCCSSTSVDYFKWNFKKSAFCSNMILAETWPSLSYLITWFVGLFLKITLKGLLVDWKCLWSMFVRWFLNITRKSRNFHAFTQAYLAHAQTNFPAARFGELPKTQNSLSMLGHHQKFWKFCVYVLYQWL